MIAIHHAAPDVGCHDGRSIDRATDTHRTVAEACSPPAWLRDSDPTRDRRSVEPGIPACDGTRPAPPTDGGESA